MSKSRSHVLLIWRFNLCFLQLFLEREQQIPKHAATARAAVLSLTARVESESERDGVMSGLYSNPAGTHYFFTWNLYHSLSPLSRLIRMFRDLHEECLDNPEIRPLTESVSYFTTINSPLENEPAQPFPVDGGKNPNLPDSTASRWGLAKCESSDRYSSAWQWHNCCFLGFP